MTIHKMISELEASQRSVKAHPDFGPDTEFESTFNRIGEVIDSLKNHITPSYAEPISGVQIGHTRARILGHDYVVRGADWYAKEIILTPVKRCQSRCTFSKSMNQSNPRRCIKCNQPETRDDYE